MFVIVTAPASAEIPVDEYEITKYDPMDDVMRVRTGGDFKFTAHDNVEIKELTSTYDDSNPLIPRVELKMRVKGTIRDNDDYKYAFTVISDNNDYIFAAYQDGTAVGFELGSSQLILGVTVSGENTNTLTISFPADEIGPPNSEFDVFGAAIYSVEDSERFIDMAPDKINLIIEPSDGSTVSGTIQVKGVIRQYDSGTPSGTTKVKIDSGSWEDVSGSDPWTYSLDTTSLSEGEHTIYTEMEGTEFADQIMINVNQGTGSYESFEFSDNRKPKVGDYYKYITVGTPKVSGINLPIASEMEIDVTDFTEVEGKDVFQLETYSEGDQELGYINYKNTIDRTSWKDSDELGTVKENTISTVEVSFRDDTEVNTTTVYTPPLENHNGFDVQVGFNNKWTFSSRADAESVTTVAGEDPTEDSYSETLSGTGECLYYLSSYSVPEGSQNDIYVIRSYYENPGISVVEFYSPELGIPIQIDTYDASRNLMFSLGAEEIDQVPFSLVFDEITFSPSKPKAESDNEIILTISNIDNVDASNVKLTVFDGDKQVEQKTISVSMGETIDEKVKWKPKSEGSHTIRATLTYQNKDLDETTKAVEVESAPDDGGGFPLIILLLIVIIVVVLLVVVLAMRSRGKKSGEVPPAETTQAEAAPVEAAPTQAAAAPVAAAPVAAAPQTQMNQETIQCPSCKKGFTVEYASKPVKVKCPNCGMEGVLN
jgi:hypothetical protein